MVMIRWRFTLRCSDGRWYWNKYQGSRLLIGFNRLSGTQWRILLLQWPVVVSNDYASALQTVRHFWNINRISCWFSDWMLIASCIVPNLCSGWLILRSSWEASSSSYSQEIQRLLRNPKVYYRFHNSQSLVPILSQMHPVHTFPSYSPKVRSNIIFPSTPRSSHWSLLFRFSDQNFICISHFSHAHYMPRPSHPPCHDDPNNI